MKVTGIAVMTFTNTETGEKREVTVKNIAPQAIYQLTRSSSRSINDLGSGSYSHLALSDTPIGDSDNPSIMVIKATILGKKLGHTFPPFNKPVEDGIRHLDTEWRFSPDVTDRNITALALSRETSTSYNNSAQRVLNGYIKLISYIKVDPPQIQAANENLDIKYRIVFTFPLDTKTIPRYRSLIYWGLTQPNSSIYLLTHTALSRQRKNSNYRYVTTGKPYHRGYVTGGNMINANVTIPRTDHAGTMHRSWLATMSAVIDDYYRSAYYSKDVKKGVNQHPLFNHKPGSSKWYEVVSNLASSQGDVAINVRDSFTTENDADMHILTITKEGAVGTARYEYKVKPLIGDVPNIGTPSGRKIPAFDKLAGIPLGDIHALPHVAMSDTTLSGYKDSHNYSLKEFFVYNSQTVLSAHNKSVFIHQVMKNDMVVFDEGSVVPIPTTTSFNNVVCRNQNGDLFLGKVGGGITHITDPLSNSPTISEIDIATLGTSEDIRALGNSSDDKIWAVSLDGVFHSDDNGATWVAEGQWSVSDGDVAYLLPALLNNYNIIQFVCCTENPTNMALHYGSNANDYHYATWYDGATNTIIPFSNNYYNSYNFLLLTRKGVWGKVSQAGFSYIKWGTSVTTTHTIKRNYPCIMMDIDEIGNPIIVANSPPFMGNTTTYGISALMTPDGTFSPSVRTESVISNYSRYYRMLPMASAYDIFDNVISPLFPFLNKYRAYKHTHYSCINDGTNSHAKSEQVSRDINGKSNSVLDDIKGITHRYDVTAGEWKAKWNAPASESGDGSSTAEMSRVNFSTDSHAFTGRSYSLIPLAGVLTGFSFLATVSAEDKLRSTLSTDKTDQSYANLQDFDRTIVELVNGDKTLTLVWEDTNHDLVLLDASDPSAIISTIVVTTLGNGVEHCVGLTVKADGSGAVVYVNGAPLVISLTTTFIVSDSTIVSLGAKYYNHVIDAVYKQHFFRGVMTNVQVWDNVLTPANMITHNTDRALLSVSGLISRYLLTEDLQEGKVVSNVYEELPYGISAKFLDATAGVSFVKDDYYNTPLVKDGVLNDNVSTWSFDHSMTPYSASYIDAIERPGNNEVTLPVIFGSYEEDSYRHPGSLGIYSYFKAHTYEPYNTIKRNRCYGAQNISGNAEIEFDITANDGGLRVGFTLASSGGDRSFSQYFLVHIEDFNIGTILIKNSTSADETITKAVAVGTRCKLTLVKASNELKFFIMENSAWVQYGTTKTVAFTEDVVLFADANSNGVWKNHALKDITLKYDHVDTIVYIGDPATNSGCFKKDFIGFSDKWMGDTKILLDNVEAIVTVVPLAETTALLIGTTVPSVGEVIFYAGSGAIVLNPADVSKTVEVTGFNALHRGL